MKVIYAGLFLQEHTPHKLPIVPDRHITMAFRPSDSYLDAFNQNLGKFVTAEVVSYGNDGRNEAFGLILEESEKALYINTAPVHMTIALAGGAKAVDSKDLIFEDRRNFTLLFRYGLFTDEGIKYSLE